MCIPKKNTAEILGLRGPKNEVRVENVSFFLYLFYVYVYFSLTKKEQLGLAFSSWATMATQTHELCDQIENLGDLGEKSCVSQMLQKILRAGM